MIYCRIFEVTAMGCSALAAQILPYRESLLRPLVINLKVASFLCDVNTHEEK